MFLKTVFFLASLFFGYKYHLKSAQPRWLNEKWLSQEKHCGNWLALRWSRVIANLYDFCYCIFNFYEPFRGKSWHTPLVSAFILKSWIYIFGELCCLHRYRKLTICTFYCSPGAFFQKWGCNSLTAKNFEHFPVSAFSHLYSLEVEC